MFGEGTTFDPNTGIIEGSPPTIDLGVSPSQLDPLGEISFNQLRSRVFDTLTNLGQTPSEAFGLLKNITFQEGGFKGLDDLLQSFNTPFTGAAVDEKPLSETPSSVISLLPSPQQFGIGGTNVSGLPIFGTIQETPITTLTQVLDLFPKLTASQAADFLGEFSGILPQAALLQGGDVINISVSPDDPPQIFNQSSVGIAGTAQQIFNLLFPNVKSNF